MSNFSEQKIKLRRVTWIRFRKIHIQIFFILFCETTNFIKLFTIHVIISISILDKIRKLEIDVNFFEKY